MQCLLDHAAGTITELDERSLLLCVGGDLREGDVEPFFDALCEIAAAHRPVRLLVDGTYLASTSLRLCWLVWKQLPRLAGLVERTGIYGLSPKLEVLLWLLVGSRRRAEVRSFLWRHEVESWVLGVLPAPEPRPRPRRDASNDRPGSDPSACRP